MAMEFERGIKKPQQTVLTSLIDVMFILVFFFMLTSSFVHTESMELSIPQAGENKIIAPTGTIRIYLEGQDKIRLGTQDVNLQELQTEMRLALFKQPDRAILLLAGAGVNVQRLVSVMDDIYVMGGQNVSIADWEE